MKRICVAGFVAVLLACGSKPPPPQEPTVTVSPIDQPTTATAQAEPADTGKDCAKAEAVCGGGICNVKVKNGCDQPVSCNLAVGATCDAAGGMVEANGRTRDTFAAGVTGSLDAKAECQSGKVVRTAIKTLSCK